MIGSLGSEFHLTKPFVEIPCRLIDGFRKQVVGHEMGTGTGSQKSAVFDKLHGS